MTRASPRLPPRARHRIPFGPALALALALAAAPALGQQGGKPAAKPGPDKPAAAAPGPDRTAAPPVIGCPSLANYRLLMRAGAAAAAAVLADPKADHLGCAALGRGRIAGIADRVSLGGRDYDCLNVQGTTACHWMEGGTLAAAPAATTTPPTGPAPASRGAAGR